MKKIFTIVSALALTLPLLAGTVTFKPSDFSGQGTSSTGSQVSATKGGVTVECNKAFGASDALRCYKDGVLKITSAANIQTLDFTFQSASGKYYNGGLADGNDLTAHIIVDSLAWSFTLASQGRITELIVTIDGEGVEPAAIDTISVTEALARLADPQGNKGECYVKGKVLSIIATNVEQYGNISYWMADINNPTDSLQAYRMKAANNANYANAMEIEFIEGDEILVYAAGLAMYHNNNTNQDIPELNTGYYVRTINGAEIVNLDWDNGSAFREDGTWELEIKKVASSNNDKLNLIFSSDKENAIAGFHALNEGSSMKLDGANLPITSGSVQLSFKSINSTGYNVYDVKIIAVAGDKVYRLGKDIEFYASKDGDEVILSGDRPFVPKEGDTITCAQAREYTLSLASGAEGMTITIHGYVTDIINTDKVYNTFWMDDEQGTKKTFEVAFYNELQPKGYQLKVGDEVIATGVALNYNGTTPEIKSGSVEVLGAEVSVIKVNVAEALAAGMALDSGATSTDFYEITGFITEVIEPYGEHKNITFWMGDAADDAAREFQAYRISCDASIADKLVAGAHVVVTAYIQNYYKAATDSTEEKHVIEAVKGSVVLYGTGVENVWDTNNSSVKIFRNGQIYIRRNDGLYNLQGIKVD